MNIIAQEIKYRLSILKFAAKNGVSAAARESTKVSRMFVYRLKRRRYDGTAESLALKSRRPHAHPNQHTAEAGAYPQYAPKGIRTTVSSYFVQAAPQGLQTLRFRGFTVACGA